MLTPCQAQHERFWDELLGINVRSLLHWYKEKGHITVSYCTVPCPWGAAFRAVCQAWKKLIPGTTARDSDDATGSISTLCSRNMLEVFMLYDDAIEVLTL